VTRLWPDGDAIAVNLDGRGLPDCLTWRGQDHGIQKVANRWLVDEEWWKKRIWREYFKVITYSGLLMLVYHDLLTGQWYLQRLYD